MRIATKVAPPIVDGVDGTRFDRAYIERKLQTSLERLGLERVTFYLSHAPDKTTPIEETVEGFAAAIEAGRAAHVGCCNVGAAELLGALDAADGSVCPDSSGCRTVSASCRQTTIGKSARCVGNAASAIRRSRHLPAAC